MEPILLKPSGKDYIWGGNRLKDEYNKNIDLSPLAETWECSAHPDGCSTVISGVYKGYTLEEVLKKHPEYMGTKYSGNEKFPLLVKLIDAEKDLSVQVHPDDEYAEKNEHQSGKTEMWYVVDSQPGASLVCGFAHAVSKDILRHDTASGQLMKHLRKVPVHKGDVFYIPAGTIHAIGAGVLIAEIQESSNLTYRVWDYDRIDKNGKKRETHLEKALEVLNFKSGEEIRPKPKRIEYSFGASREVLCRCKYFETERIRTSMGISFVVNGLSFQVILCIEGAGSIENDEMEKPLKFRKGDCIFIPAGAGKTFIIGEAEMLKIRC